MTWIWESVWCCACETEHGVADRDVWKLHDPTDRTSDSWMCFLFIIDLLSVNYHSSCSPEFNRYFEDVEVHECLLKAWTPNHISVLLNLSRRNSVAWGGRVGSWESLCSRGGVDVNVDRHFLFRWAREFFSSGPEEPSVFGRVWKHGTNVLNYYVHHVWAEKGQVLNIFLIETGFCVNAYFDVPRTSSVLYF